MIWMPCGESREQISERAELGCRLLSYTISPPVLRAT